MDFPEMIIQVIISCKSGFRHLCYRRSIERPAPVRILIVPREKRVIIFGKSFPARGSNPHVVFANP